MVDGNTALARTEPNYALIEQVVIRGDLKGLTATQKSAYYGKVCESIGLNPLTRPFEYIVLNGREVLYARKDCADQLRRLYGITITITSRERIDDIYIVTARARMPAGREDESTGAVTIAGKKGDDLANALMKAETKAKRRATLSICGLGMLDETEVETIPQQAREPAKVTRITPHAEPDEDPDGRGDAHLQAQFMQAIENIEMMVDEASTWEQCEEARKQLGARNRVTALTSSFREARNNRKLGPADEAQFTKVWQRCNRKLEKKEAELDPGSAAEFVTDPETGEVSR
jgi:hypothetical protein